MASGDTNGVATPSGLGLKSLYFDGNDAMNINGAEPFSTTVGSMNIWFYNDGTSSGKAVLMFGDTDATRYLGFETKVDGIATQMNNVGTQWEARRSGSGTGIPNGGALSDGWHMCTLSQNGTAVKMYVDKVELTTWDQDNDLTKWMVSDLDNGRIGCVNRSSYGNTDYFTGNVMEIGLWNVALTSTQITSLYNDGDGRLTTTESTGLRAYYSGSSSPATNDAVEVYPNLPNGSVFITSDTNVHYMWNSSADTWHEVA